MRSLSKWRKFQSLMTALKKDPLRQLYSGPDTVEELLDWHLVKKEKKKGGCNGEEEEAVLRQRLMSSEREALSLYRDIIRATRFFLWPDQRGVPWCVVLRENARREFEEARFERDPEVIHGCLSGEGTPCIMPLRSLPRSTGRCLTRIGTSKGGNLPHSVARDDLCRIMWIMMTSNCIQGCVW